MTPEHESAKVKAWRPAQAFEIHGLDTGAIQPRRRFVTETLAQSSCLFREQLLRVF